MASALLVLILPTIAQARLRLDPSFGVRGQVIRAVHLDEHHFRQLPQAEQLPSGRIVVLENRALFGFEPDGRPAPGFALPTPAPAAPGTESIFEVLGTAQGEGVVIAGEEPDLFGGFPLDPIEVSPHDANVVRYTRDGETDPSFANGGPLFTNFGLPAPPEAQLPTVWIAGAALDAQGRTVLTGLRATDKTPVFCSRGGGSFLTEAFIARLNPNGSLDPSFGQGGIVRLDGMNGSSIPYSAEIGQPILDGESGVYFEAQARGECGSGPPLFLTHLRSDGSPDPGFGSSGWRPLPPARLRAGPLVDAADGRFLFADAQGSVAVLRSDGSLETHFGHRGLARPFRHRSGLQFAAARLDPAGGVWLDGDRFDRRGHSFIAHLTPAGRPDRRVGDQGIAFTRFGSRRLSSQLNDLLIDKRGRPIVVGEGLGKRMKTSALILARYLRPH
jgi:uncharacterized delta-60 repeat protein